MHLSMVLLTLLLACTLRLGWVGPIGGYSQRWRSALSLFLIPSLLLVVTALAIVIMGPQGRMFRHREGWLSYGVALGFLAIAVGLGLYLAWHGWQAVRQARQHPKFEIAGYSGRLVGAAGVFSAQVGFWRPELLVSQGMLDYLDESHLEAVLTHEQGHHHYHDTFWFFWLGWLRRLTFWLPQTEALWQELLLLREIRADQWAAQQIDKLILAESLIQVVQTPLLASEEICAAFSCDAPCSRLEQRINALLDETYYTPSPNFIPWMRLLITLSPLMLVPFHH
ncbi:MAG: M56 family metallopeptidase [Leptolyngbyaceae cyanobacterium MO_188.B28]|nr:M56 family metallopeptidase [Leptolyngbyaceae cyanobacterium MO_188.B28]